MILYSLFLGATHAAQPTLLLFVAPAQAGVQGLWIPACAGMTDLGGKPFMVRGMVLFVVS